MQHLTTRRILTHLSPQAPLPRRTLPSILTLSHVRHVRTHPPLRQPALSPSNEPLLPAPGPKSGPLLTRHPNRALPHITSGLSSSTKTWLKTFPLFILLITLSSLSIFNYQKTTSSTVQSILYALRTNDEVRALLGDEIYFASQVPWVRGKLNPLQGEIDIAFWVKGTKGMAETKFVSRRGRRDGFFVTEEWSLRLADGRVVQLYVDGEEPVEEVMPGVVEVQV